MGENVLPRCLVSSLKTARIKPRNCYNARITNSFTKMYYFFVTLGKESNFLAAFSDSAEPLYFKRCRLPASQRLVLRQQGRQQNARLPGNIVHRLVLPLAVLTVHADQVDCVLHFDFVSP